MSVFWKDYQKFLGKKIPNVIIDILIANGYDNSLSLCGMSMNEISSIEKFTDEKLRYLLDKSQQYSTTKPFVFLPGHKKLLLILGEKAKEYESTGGSCVPNRDSFDLTQATTMMQELVNTMKANTNLAPNSRRYTNTIRWFSTYLYMLGGKKLYEVLSKNFSLPQLPTVGK